MSSGHNPIFVAGGVVCQVCGEHLRDDDTRIWLNVGDRIGFDPETYVELYADPWDKTSKIHVTTSIGPLHPWCARVSLRFCPELTVSDPKHVVGWRCDVPPTEKAYLATYDFDEFGGNVWGLIDTDQLIDLNQLDRIVEANKKQHP